MFPLFLLLFRCGGAGTDTRPSQVQVRAEDFGMPMKRRSFLPAAIDKGWHVYSTDLGDGGPISATFNVEKISGAEVARQTEACRQGNGSAFDKLFEMKVRYFENTAQFVQKLKLTGGAYQLEGYLEYGACNDENCLPPTQVPFQFSGEAEGAAKGQLLQLRLKRKVGRTARKAGGCQPTWFLWLLSVVRTDRRKSM